MSGKTKQANRTKNNVRPSSSGRSAEILSSTVNPTLVLVGPGKLLPTVFPSLAGQVAEHPLSNQFLLCFKKFHKKDPITKIKALNELNDLVANSEQDEVVNALGSWAHYYPSLTVDMDRKVREATQICHGDIVRKCGRQVALHIKRLMPAWLMAQHDEHPPVQRIAHANLHGTFPDNKLTEAIKFCKVDICNLYMDNLKGNAEYMVGSKKIDDEEERQAQIARVMSCTLRAMELLIAELPDNQADWLWSTLLPLLCANSFWKLASHSAPAVRASFYIMTGAVVDRFYPQLPTELARRCARTLLAQQERAPAVCVQRWRTLLKLMFSVQDFLDLMDNKDLLLKRLWDVFENAAWGEARPLGAVLGRLLRMVPDDVQTEVFYDKFFAALFTGLRQKTLLSNESEREHWNGIIAESIKHVATARRHAPYVVGLVGRAHRAWLQSVFTVGDHPGKTALVTGTATHMAGVLERWAIATEGEDSTFDRIARECWLNVSSVLSDELAKLPVDSEDIAKMIDAHMHLLIALKRSLSSGQTRAAPDEAASERCLRDLQNATESVIAHVFDYTHKHRLVRKVLPVLMPAVDEFQSSKMFDIVAQKFESATIFEFYERVLKAWLADNSQRCVTVAELAFLLVHYLEDAEQDALFDSFGALPSEVFRWGLALALAAPGRARGAPRWLRSAAVARALAALARLQDDAAAADLLLATLTTHYDGDVIVCDEAISGIVGTCSDMLTTLISHDPAITLPEQVLRGWPGGSGGGGRRRDASDPYAPLEPRVLFGARVVHALAPRRAASALPLMSALFRLTLRVPRNSPLLAAEAWTAAMCAWRESARRLPPAPCAAFVRDALQHLHLYLFQDVKTLNIKRIDHVASLCPYIVIAGATSADHVTLAAHSRLMLDVPLGGETAPAPLEVFALQEDVVWGDLHCPFEQDNDWIAAVAEGGAVLTEDAILVHAYRVLFRATYVNEVLLHPAPAHEGEAPRCHALLQVEYFRDQFCNILHDYSVLNVLYEHYAFWEHYDIIRQVRDRMDELVTAVVVQVPADGRDLLAAALEERAANGYYWSYAKRHYRRIVSTLLQSAGNATDTPEDDDVEPESAVGTPEGDRLHASSPLSRSSSSFDILDTFESIDPNDPGDASDTDASNDVLDADAPRVAGPSDPNEDGGTSVLDNLIDTKVSTDYSDIVQLSCDCHRLYATTDEVFYPLLLGQSSAECGARSAPGRPPRAAPPAALPTAKLAGECDHAALFKDLLGKIMLADGYFHDAQMRAKDVKKQKLLAKAKFDRLQDSVLTKFELNGQYRIFEKWNEDPDVYRRLDVDVDEGVLYMAKDFAMLRSYYCVYADHAPHVDEFISDIAAEDVQCYLDAVINGYYRHNDTMLFERSLQGASWLRLSSTAAVLDLLCEAVTSRGWDASPLHWDFANIALCSAFASLTLSVQMWTGDAVRLALVARPALELYVRVRRFNASVRRQCTRRMPSVHVVALPREWEDIFAPEATRNILLLICHVLDASSRAVSAPQVAILHGLTEASKLLEPTAVPAVLAAGPLTLPRLVRAATRVLADTCHHGFKYLAYYTLRTLAPALINVDEALLAAPRDPTRDLDLTLALYDEHLEQLQELVDAALCNYAVCDDICEMAPHTDSHSVMLGYLLLCVALHRHCELATGDLAVHYTTFFNEHQYVQGILPAALRLLPAAVVHYMAVRVPTLPKRFLPWFIRLQDFDVNEASTGAAVARLACGVVLRALGGPGGAAARDWWGVLRSREASALARLVQRAVAPVLVNHQLAELKARARDLGPNAKVSVCWGARSAAVMLRGDQQPPPALRVSLGAAHPLHAPRVLSAQQGPDPHWVSLFLGNQNGRVFDAMRLWVESMSSGPHHEAHCYVCYCHAHPSDGTTPSVACPQCCNTFHTHCVRRWFRISSRSNCPVCRTNF